VPPLFLTNLWKHGMTISAILFTPLYETLSSFLNKTMVILVFLWKIQHTGQNKLGDGEADTVTISTDSDSV
ncbi:MAG: hypothetical protein JXA25_17435, partial [Anaerolineales bacterium]|nr:hypothetical protein [Anaerolineales bacterium]